MRLSLISFLLLAYLFTCSLASSWSSDALPNPQSDPTHTCRRFKPSAVCDPDGYLSESDADTIDGLINFIHAGTHGFHKVACPPRANTPIGAQLAVAIFERMPPSNADKIQRAFHFARDLHDRWGVGDPDCQNGVVIAFAVKDRAVGFSIGKGVNPIFQDSMLPAIVNDMKPMLRDGEYGAAIIKGVTDVGNILSGEKAPPSARSDWFGIAAMAAIGGTFAAVAAASEYRKRDKYKRCKERLRRIDSDRQRASEQNYVITSCPICLEDFAPASRDDAERIAVPDTSVTAAGGFAEHGRLLAGHNGGAQSTIVRVAGDGGVAGDAEDREEGNSVRTLGCGHKFHESCIASWMTGGRRANAHCPICRQPIDGDEAVEPRTNEGLPSGWDVYEPEYSFRMRRMRHYYPDFITWSMIDDWHGYRHSHHRRMETSRQFKRVDPAVVAAAARASGSGGSSFSFGGGSSAGGGGGGGSW